MAARRSPINFRRATGELAHAYDMYEQTRIDYKFGIQGARQEGERKGKLEIARNLKKMSLPVGQTVLATGLSADEIAKL